MNIKNLAIPTFVALSLVFTGCAGSQIETPDAVDDTMQDGVEGVEQGAGEAGNAIDGGIDNMEQGAEDATGAIEDGTKDLGKDIEDAAGTAKDNVQQGLDDAGNAVENLGNEAPGNEAEAE